MKKSRELTINGERLSVRERSKRFVQITTFLNKLKIDKCYNSAGLTGVLKAKRGLMQGVSEEEKLVLTDKYAVNYKHTQILWANPKTIQLMKHGYYKGLHITDSKARFGSRAGKKTS